MNAVDPLEQRDPWRAAWQAVSHDAVLAVLALVTGAGALAIMLLPQAPSSADAIAYNQWVAQARLRQELLFDLLQGLGLTSVAESAWFRLAAIALIAIGLARLLDRVLSLSRARSSGPNLDEVRARVTSDAPAFDTIAQRLRKRGYAIAISDDQLRATRAPLAETVSIVMHLGAVLTALGLLINIMLGWDASQQTLVLESATVLNNEVTLTLNPVELDAKRVVVGVEPGAVFADLAQGDEARARDVTVRLIALQSGFRIRATAADGKALGIRTSNYLSPTEDARVMFDEQGSLSVQVPDARIVLTVLKGDPGEVQAFGIGTATELARAPLAQSITIDGTTFSLEPSIGALVDVRRRPGNVPAWAGLLMMIGGATGSWLHPMRRLRVKHHGHWTELYASGRGVRTDVIDALTLDPPVETPTKPGSQAGNAI